MEEYDEDQIGALDDEMEEEAGVEPGQIVSEVMQQLLEEHEAKK